jgi:hypothetical protein
MPIETVARIFRSAVVRERERLRAELADARWPDVRPVPMAEHLAALPATVPDPDDAPDGDEEEDETDTRRDR